MDEGLPERRLRSIGEECFATFFEQFRDPSLSNEQVASLLSDERGHKAPASRTRTSVARRIIKQGRAKDALTNISLAMGVEDDIRKRASTLAARL